MRNKLQQSDSGNQLRPVILLLIAAVILPTVCLLWFMTQAVKNERLAVRQKLEDTYQSTAQESIANIEQEIGKWKHLLSRNVLKEPLPDAFLRVTDTRSKPKSQIERVVFYDSDGKLVYPRFFDGFEEVPEFEEKLQKAWELEFAGKKLDDALKAYKDIESNTKDEILKKRMQLAQVRVYRKKSYFDEAIALCGKAKETGHGDKGGKAYLRANAQLVLTELYKENGQTGKHLTSLRNLLSMIGNYNTGSGFLLDITSDQRIFLADKALAMYDKIKDDPKSQMVKMHVEIVRQTVIAERMSLNAVEKFPAFPLNEKWTEETFRQIQFDETTSYGMTCQIADNQVLAIVSKEDIAEMWNSAAKELLDDIVYCKVFDDQGQFIAGGFENIDGSIVINPEEFLSLEPSKYFNGWKVDVYFLDGVFGDAAKRTRLAYGWTAALVIAFMVLICGFAVKSVLHQAAVNRLKNDFVATVTHELKTPLASMRVLVDTLLEGNYNDQQQAKEYLELIAKENKRLTGLIDNFLTFSRMERNKQAFEIVSTNARIIAQTAADAVRTKFNGGTCKFIVTIDDDPASILADADAMVTVLVNLLDNAYKYSGDEKQIELAVYDENGQVCFAVKDNGIGMSNRAMKKIFERFYQADSRLSRDVEGCGLGLSIVKFIVDAHNGTIEVDSETGKGSTFVVKIPSA